MAPTIANTLLSALEGLVALLLCSVAASSVKSMVFVDSQSPWHPHVSGVLRLLITTTLFVALYGRRFSPTSEGWPATLRAVRW